MKTKCNFFWFRRDLRLADNHGLFEALSAGKPVQCVFIFDRNILDKLTNREDARVTFIHDQLMLMDSELKKNGGSILSFFGTPEEAWAHWCENFEIDSVFTNHDYEPYARQRDESVQNLLTYSGVQFKSFKDQVIFEKSEVVKDDGLAYTVFTPFKNKFYKTLSDSALKPYPSEKLLDKVLQNKSNSIHDLKSMGFGRPNIPFPPVEIREGILEHYKEWRDIPSLPATSRVSVHLRFGTVSIRKLASSALEKKSEAWMNELIWRDFYHMIIWHFPHSAKRAFKPAYDRIKWRNNEDEFEKWCKGMTGYPIVDAGMRELNATGFMHNRVRMITASFLVKHLLIDWRWGEAYFAEKLLDFDLAANNGGWQWAAGSGCDAAPYFRVFNPYEQTKKFDSEYKYIRKWVPEFEDFRKYPQPIVEHKFARERCLSVFKEGLAKAE
ncbi:MAG: cryptochrome/photolyase family protein [Bacteroidota bacterium]|jgi:deoxyribodipyrimidine photo-lyase